LAGACEQRTSSVRRSSPWPKKSSETISSARRAAFLPPTPRAQASPLCEFAISCMDAAGESPGDAASRAEEGAESNSGARFAGRQIWGRKEVKTMAETPSTKPSRRMSLPELAWDTINEPGAYVEVG